MQNVAHGHPAAYTQREFHIRGIYPILWPAFSPEIKSMKAVWSKVMDYIEKNYPGLPNGK
jgi:hypothetical protein